MMESMFTIQELLDFVLLLPLAFSLLAASGFFKGGGLHWADRLTATLVAVAVWQIVLLFPADSSLPCFIQAHYAASFPTLAGWLPRRCFQKSAIFFFTTGDPMTTSRMITISRHHTDS